MNSVRMLLLLLAVVWSARAIAHDPTHADTRKAISAEEHAFGRQGDPKRVSRTIAVDMSDAMRYSPASLKVKRGETIRLQVTNSGKMPHELVLGTMADLKTHAELMRKYPGMEHDEPHMLHVRPGSRQTLVWQFTKAGEFYYGCLIPGHFETGMVGKITVAGH
jgi:uncharacterized cupredoxin-like copper-binding protein